VPAPDVVVIGGGIIGLAIAEQLVRRGAGVTVLERRACGSEASGAAAGMLAPLAETALHGAASADRRPFLTLALAGLEAHPPWLERLRAETGLDVGPHGPGMLRITDESGVDALRSAFDRQRSLGLPLEWLDGAALNAAEPALASAAAAIRSPREQHVQPPVVVQALVRSLTARGGAVRESTPARGFVTRGARVLAVRTDDGELACAEVVIAGGAWTPGIAAKLGAAVLVEPVRGQILALAPQPVPFRHTLYGPDGYLVPKPEGRLIVGATEDQAGFDARPTASGVARLLAMATRLSPSLADAPFAGAWAGLRPASADRQPLLGPLPEWENVALATGHFRNGVLLAPLTGQLLTEWVRNRHVPPLMAPFLPAGRCGGVRADGQSSVVSHRRTAGPTPAPPPAYPVR
jgi:glycine oxidase